MPSRGGKRCFAHTFSLCNYSFIEYSAVTERCLIKEKAFPPFPQCPELGLDKPGYGAQHSGWYTCPCVFHKHGHPRHKGHLGPQLFICGSPSALLRPGRPVRKPAHGHGSQQGPATPWQGSPSASGLRVVHPWALGPGSPWQSGLEEGLARGFNVSNAHLFGADLHVGKATQRVLGPVVEAQVAVGDLALMLFRRVHEVSGPTQHVAHAILILKVLCVEGAGSVGGSAPP